MSTVGSERRGLESPESAASAERVSFKSRAARSDRSWAQAVLAICAVLGFGLCGIGCGDDGGGAGGGGGFSMPPTPVEVSTVGQGALVDRFHAVGTFRAVHSAAVVSEVAGIIRDLPFDEGQPVRRGTLLARLDDAELAATLARAEAVLEQSRNSFERVQRVVERNAAAPQDLDDARAALQVAEADVRLAQARLDKTRIRARFDGHVGPQQVSPGAFVQAGQVITELTHLDELEIEFNAPERDLPRLVLGAEVEVSTPAYPGVTEVGRLTVIDPVVDERTRTIRVIGRVGNPGLRFRPGMSADVTAVFGIKSDALTVPSAAVFAQGSQTLVYVVAADSTVQSTPVVLGTRLAATVEVVDGLSEGDQIVRAGHQKLFPGAKVMPIPSEGGGQSS